MTPPTILGIDPGTKEMGIAVLRGRELVACGVHTLRNGERPYKVVGQARGIVLRYIERRAPAVVAIEAPLPIATKRGALLSVIAQELGARARELKLQVLELPPEQVRQIVAGNPRATKMDVAERLVRMGFDGLRSKLPRRPKHPVLWLSRRDRYWLHVFDALALALAAQRTQDRSGESPDRLAVSVLTEEGHDPPDAPNHVGGEHNQDREPNAGQGAGGEQSEIGVRSHAESIAPVPAWGHPKAETCNVGKS